MEESLRELLPAPAATFQSVLFMGQGALERTVENLSREREALHTLGDLLRVSVDQTAGVSVERLRARLSERIAAAFGHWDRQTNLPEKGRGIENKWLRDAGSILEAYYAREELRQELREANELESERDRKLTALSDRAAELEAARGFVRENEAFVQSAAERETVEVKLARARSECEGLKKDFDAWVAAEFTVKQCRPEVESLTPVVRALEAEFKGALERNKNKDRVMKLERARAASSAVQDAKKRIAAVPALRAEDMRRLRGALREVEALKAQAKGGNKLQVQLHVRRDLDVTFRKDFEGERKGTMPAGKSMTLNAGARIQIASELFEIQVTGGENSLGDIESGLHGAQEALAKLFAELKVKNFEEAEERERSLLQLGAELKAAELELARALPAGETLEKLESTAGEPGAGGRELEVVSAELQLKKGELDSKQKGLGAAEAVLKNLRDRTGEKDSEAISERLLERRGAVTALERDLAKLPVLPERLGKISEFLPRYREMQAKAAQLSETISVLKVEVAEVKTKLGERSAQEADRAAREAGAKFDRELARGRALLRVEEAVQALAKEGGDLYGNFRGELEKQVAALSRGKYGRTTLDEALPALIERHDGVGVPYDWLSAGTKDSFALALRLAMAGHFLGASDGFLLMDDPLVNMDPERQKVAAELLKEFAREKQVVLFTCHPAHAELLGGNRIALGV